MSRNKHGYLTTFETHMLIEHTWNGRWFQEAKIERAASAGLHRGTMI